SPKPSPSTTPTKIPTFDLMPHRPGFRSGIETGPAVNVARHKVDRTSGSSATTSTWAPMIPGTQTSRERPTRNDNYVHSNSAGGSSGGFGSTRTDPGSSHT